MKFFNAVTAPSVDPLIIPAIPSLIAFEGPPTLGDAPILGGAEDRRCLLAGECRGDDWDEDDETDEDPSESVSHSEPVFLFDISQDFTFGGGFGANFIAALGFTDIWGLGLRESASVLSRVLFVFAMCGFPF
jgi:hypothetical protein